MNILICANGSGKTNILEAIGVLSAAASGIVQTRMPEGLTGGRLADAIKELQNLILKDEFIEDAFVQYAKHAIDLGDF